MGPTGTAATHHRKRVYAPLRALGPLALVLALALALAPAAYADSWTTSGTPLSLPANPTAVVIDRVSSTPYAVVGDGTSAQIVGWDGTAWTTLPGSSTLPTTATNIGGLIGDSASPVIAWWDAGVSRWKVSRYSGGTWNDLALPAVTDYGDYADDPQLVGSSASPVLVRRLFSQVDWTGDLYVSRYDAGTWTTSKRYDATSSVPVHSYGSWASGSTIVLAYSVGAGPYDITAEKWGGGSWSALGTPDGTGSGTLPAVTVASGRAWVAYVDGTDVKVAENTSGTTWVARMGETSYTGVRYTGLELRSVADRPTLGVHLDHVSTRINNDAGAHALGITHHATYEWWGRGFVHVGGDAYGGEEQVVPAGHIGGIVPWQGRPAIVRGTAAPNLELRTPVRGSTSLSSRLLPTGVSSADWTIYGGCSGQVTFSGSIEDVRADVDTPEWYAGWCNDPDGSGRYVTTPADPSSSSLRADFAGLPVQVPAATNVRARVRAREAVADADTIGLTINLRKADATLLSTATVSVTAEQVFETPAVDAVRADLRGAYVEVIATDTTGGVAGTTVSVDSVNIDFGGTTDWTARLRPDGVVAGTGDTLVSDGGTTCAFVGIHQLSTITGDVETEPSTGCVDFTASDSGVTSSGIELSFGTVSLLGGAVVDMSPALATQMEGAIDPYSAWISTGATTMGDCADLHYTFAFSRVYCNRIAAFTALDQTAVDALQFSYYHDTNTQQFDLRALQIDVLVQPPVSLPPPGVVRDGSTAPDTDGTTSPDTLTANWDAVTHPDLASYDSCFSTSSTGADCATTAIAPWQNATATNTTRGSLALAAGTTYYACVRSVHVDASTSGVSCSDGVVVDSTTPSVPTLVAPADGAALAATPTLEATYVDATTSGRVEFQVCAVSDCSTVSATGSSAVVASSTNGTWAANVAAGTWHWRARNVDAAGNTSAWTGTWSFTYNQAPTATAISPAANAWVTSTQPALQVRHDDGDGGAGTVTIETCDVNAADPWSTNCGASYQAMKTAPGSVANGQIATLTPNVPLPQGTSYWRGRTADSGGTTSAWTTARAVQVDSLQPTPTPTVTFRRSGLGKIDVMWDTATDSGFGSVTWDVEAWNDTLGIWESLCTDTTALSCTKSGLGGDKLLIARVRVCDGLDNCSSWVANGGGANSGYLLRTTASTNLNNATSRVAQLPPGGTLDTTSTGVTLPGGGPANRAGSFPFHYNVTSPAKVTLDTTAPIDPQDVPSGRGWVIDEVEGKTLPAGGMGMTVVTDAVSGTGDGTGHVLCRAWRAQTDGATSLVSWTHLGDDAGDVADVMTASGIRTTSVCDLANAFPVQTSFAADEVLYVELVLETPAGGGSSGDAYRLVFNDTAGSTIDIPQPGLPPLAPLAVAPADAALVSTTPTLSATYRHPTPRDGVLTFEVATDSAFTSVVQTLTTTQLADAENGSVQTAALTPGTQYHWRVRGTDAGSLVGPWSSTRSFTANSPPAPPALVSPADGATLVGGSVTFEAGAFSDVDTANGDTHTASQWQVITSGGSWSTPLADSGTAAASTTWSGPSFTDGDYQWRVRYRDGFDGWSAWSVVRSFTVSSGSVSIGIDDRSLDMGIVLRGTDAFASTNVRVSATAATGYTLSATDASDTVAWNCGCGSTVADWTGTDAEPTLWPASSEGYAALTIRDAPGGRLPKWGDGTATAETDVDANRYAGLRSSISTVLHAHGSPTTGDVLVATWRLNIAAASGDGIYSTATTLTAVANP